MLLGVVLQSLQPVKLLATYKRAHQLPTMLCPFARSLSTRVTHCTWVNPHKPTARAIQKDVLYKKEEKYGAYRKRTTEIMNVFNDTQLRLIFTSLIHFTKNQD